MTVNRARCLLISIGLAGVLFGAGCASREQVNARPVAASEPASSSSSNADQLRDFRVAAAATPYWATADFSLPGTIAQVSWQATSVVVGTVTAGTVDEPPLDVVPYTGAPTVSQLQVGVVVDAQSVIGGSAASELRVQLPVLSGTPEAIDDARDIANQLRTAVPVGTRVVVVVRDRGSSIVAMEASTGELVGFHPSLDPVVAGLNVDDLARQISAHMGA